MRVMWARGIFCVLLAVGLAFCIRLLEWPAWQNPEYRINGEMLLATHDAYHWLAGAVGFGRAAGHPMAEMLRLGSEVTGINPANLAFWFPAGLASLLAGMVTLWGFVLGGRETAVTAGLIASIAPGFLGRTLLGYYDTDLVTLFFPLLMSLGPGLFCQARLLLPGELWRRARGKAMPADKGAAGARWVLFLWLFGLIAWQSQGWHSVFPYLCRYNALLLTLMSIALAPQGRRAQLLAVSLSYSLPALAGPAGSIWPALVLLLMRRPAGARMAQNPWLLGMLCLLLAWLLCRGEIAATIVNQVNAYLKHAPAAGGGRLAGPVFPSVAQSIIEVQDLSFAALFSYFHPWQEAAMLGLIGFMFLLCRYPGTLFLLPLLALGLLSQKLGGRMVMFGAPIVGLGLTVPLLWLFRAGLPGKARALAAPLCAVLLAGVLVAPFLSMVPALSQGPSINRRHAQALIRAREITPPDSMLWLWWDFGYAAHYFARRQTICDGAMHSGPSLYLPACVYATDNPRFARQVIARAAEKGNVPGNFFAGLDDARAQELVNTLRSRSTPLLAAPGRQYVMASFEMLRLGFWISNFGSWNFVTRSGEGGALSIVPQSLSYQLKSGQVRLAGSENIIYPTSISVFGETGLIRRDYVREWFSEHKNAGKAQAGAFLATRRNINFLFNRVTDEKIAADQTIYNSLMVQLLLCDPQDARFTPYFRLVYDNVFARIWEVLPAEGVK